MGMTSNQTVEERVPNQSLSLGTGDRQVWALFWWGSGGGFLFFGVRKGVG